MLKRALAPLTLQCMRRWVPTSAPGGEEAARDVAVLDGRDLRLRALAWADVTVGDARRIVKAASAAVGGPLSKGVLRMVEVGAGSGFVAWMLERFSEPPHEVAVEAFDSQCGKTHVGAWMRQKGVFPWSDKVLQGGVEDAVVTMRQAHALFLVWPESDNPMAADALAAFEKARGSGEGSVLVYVGEDEGGETADGDFFAAVRANWTELESWELDGTPGTHVRVYKQQMHR